MCISREAWHTSSATVSATYNRSCGAGRGNSVMLLSASSIMRAIMLTASTGYFPEAVSAESMTASEPSKIALATSEASARVGRGFSVMDSSICVAVITGRRNSAAHLPDAQFDQSVRKKNAVAAMDLARQRLEDGADAGGIAEHARGGDHELLAGAQDHGRAAGKRSGSNLGALQIGEDGDGFVNLQGRRAQHGEAFGVIRVRAVREIEARDVHARVQQPFDGARRAAGRPDGADNFGVAKSHLFGDREIGHDVQQHLDPFIEGCHGKAFVITVHAL